LDFDYCSNLFILAFAKSKAGNGVNKIMPICFCGCGKSFSGKWNRSFYNASCRQRSSRKFKKAAELGNESVTQAKIVTDSKFQIENRPGIKFVNLDKRRISVLENELTFDDFLDIAKFIRRIDKLNT
jgi:hypothetical protein